MSQKNFAIEPSISITRTRIKRPFTHLTTMKLGELTPIYLNQDCLPGSTYSIDLASLIRMSTPLTDIMDDIFMDVFAFFVPNRLLWSHWKEFMGENNSGAGIQTHKYTVPQANILGVHNGQNGAVGVSSLGHHLGLPITTGKSGTCNVSVLPARAYYMIYNEWFRDENLIAPFAISTGDSGISGVGLSGKYYGDSLLKVAKDSDYFTRALPFTQKGDPVKIPLGTTAPIYADNYDGVAGYGALNAAYGAGDDKGFVYSKGADASSLEYAPVYADLQNATAATINDLRFAFQTQRLLEAKARFGTRYFEILKGVFGVSPSDASLQRPQYLGGTRIHINVDQIVATADTSPDGGAGLGSVGANSVTGNKSKLFTVSTQEHGIIMILAAARHKQTYANGAEAGWFRKNETDFYFPQYANIGNMPIYNRELFISGSSIDDEAFGFQEAWASYRYHPSKVSGYLDPNANSTLAVWSLANKFASLPTFSQSFIEQDRSNISRALVTGSNGPDFLCDFYFDETAVLPMPLYSIPGLIDHH